MANHIDDALFLDWAKCLIDQIFLFLTPTINYLISSQLFKSFFDYTKNILDWVSVRTIWNIEQPGDIVLNHKVTNQITSMNG